MASVALQLKDLSVFDRLAGTRAVDADGRPLLLHHGTDMVFDRFRDTRDLGIHFGSRAQAANRLEDLASERKMRRTGARKRIVAAAINVRNPLLLPDDPVAWPSSYLIPLFRRFISDADVRRLEKVSRDDRDGHRLAVAEHVRTALQAAGHDALLYRNVIETPGRSRALGWSWCVFDPAHIVILGEDLPHDAIEIPESLSDSFGRHAVPTDPRKIPGGLRHRSGEFVYAADVNGFEATAVRRLLEAGATGLAVSGKGSNWKELHLDLALPDGGRIKATIVPRLGRIMLVPDADNEYQAMARLDLCDDSGSISIGLDRGLCFEWQPGECADDTMDRVDRAAHSWREQTPAAESAPRYGT